MMSGYRAGHSWTQGFDGLHCRARRSMLEDYAEPREVFMELS
jgi:hypothetical protein